ncbi:MAG: hypothetical protein ABSB59_43830 [Streptosporangiaceae bacterium]
MPDLTGTSEKPGQDSASPAPQAHADVPPRQPGHPVHALATFELSRYRRELEHAITGTSPDPLTRDGLRRQLDDVLAEQQSRAQLRHASRKGAP